MSAQGGTTSKDTFTIFITLPLLLVWPDYGQRWVSATLRAYRGATVLYVGEGKAGCTGDAAFHAALAARFPAVSVHPIPQFANYHDALYICRRSGI